MLSTYALRMAALALALLPAMPSAARDAVPAHWETIYDFLVQDVCTDKGGNILAGATPLDGPERCPYRRDIRIGERLPYRKHDWPREGDKNNPAGIQRSDNIPVRTRSFGTAVVQSRQFLRDGREDGDIYLFSDKSVAIGLTEDGSGGIQLFYGPQCLAEKAPARILDSWIVVDRSFSLIQPGSTTARLTRNRIQCVIPDSAFTRWKTKTIEFRTSKGQRSMTTLISEHFGGDSLKAADHLERFYYTRELGLMRWERWENPGKPQAESPVEKKARTLARSKRCEPVHEIPEGGGHWLMVDCRQWTNLIASAEAQGDLPPRWIERLRKEPVTNGLFEE